jgi:hypothetical protein
LQDRGSVVETDDIVQREFKKFLGKKFREKEIGRYGVFGTPALIINGKVKSVGKVPSRADLRKRLNNAKEG